MRARARLLFLLLCIRLRLNGKIDQPNTYFIIIFSPKAASSYKGDLLSSTSISCVQFISNKTVMSIKKNDFCLIKLFLLKCLI